MPKYIFLFILFAFQVSAQPYYTRIRAAIGGEAFGSAPKGQIFAETLFGYRKKSFFDLQAGLGVVTAHDFFSYSLASSLTYSYILNPYRRKSCQPHPGYNSFESYLEAGLGSFYVDTYDSYTGDLYKQRLLTPLALAGLRFHLISERWVYIVKLRYTPAILENKLSSIAGVALALGWR
jgi:hypothetical protein